MVDLRAEIYLYSLLFPNFQVLTTFDYDQDKITKARSRHAPFYRMVVAPAQSRRDGRFIEYWEPTTPILP